MRSTWMLSLTLAALASGALLVPSAHAAGERNRYAVVTLVNQTPYRIHYSYKWGDTDRTWRGTIEPHGTYAHWWTLGAKEWAPWFHVQRDGDAGWYRCGSFFSPRADASAGREYAWRVVGQGESRTIGLFERLYRN